VKSKAITARDMHHMVRRMRFMLDAQDEAVGYVCVAVQRSTLHTQYTTDHERIRSHIHRREGPHPLTAVLTLQILERHSSASSSWCCVTAIFPVSRYKNA
jgi:hypothetical protein